MQRRVQRAHRAQRVVGGGWMLAAGNLARPFGSMTVGGFSGPPSLFSQPSATLSLGWQLGPVYTQLAMLITVLITRGHVIFHCCLDQNVKQRARRWKNRLTTDGTSGWNLFACAVHQCFCVPRMDHSVICTMFVHESPFYLCLHIVAFQPSRVVYVHTFIWLLYTHWPCRSSSTAPSTSLLCPHLYQPSYFVLSWLFFSCVGSSVPHLPRSWLLFLHCVPHHLKARS